MILLLIVLCVDCLAWTTICTLLGSLTAVLLAPRRLPHFSGKGLVDEYLVANADYAASVALGAGLTVLWATRCGMPVSTTHVCCGSLIGIGCVTRGPLGYDSEDPGLLGGYAPARRRSGGGQFLAATSFVMH